jgi:hypothetical protein
LLGILHVKFFILDSVLLEMGIIEDYYPHGVLEVFGILQIDLGSLLT